MNIALIGFGNVAQGLISIINQQQAHIPRPINVVAVARRSGTLYDPNGLDITHLTSDFAAYPDSDTLQRNIAIETIITDSNADAIIEVTPTDLETGEPALSYCRQALAAGKHVVTANKGPIALAYPELLALANANNVTLGIEGTVMSGTPAMNLGLRALAGTPITAISGILNGTTNYILTQMENGQDYADALKQAQDLGYAEADPTADVEGYDALSKVIILANTVMGAQMTADDIACQGISHLTAADIDAAREAGERWKLIGSIETLADGNLKAAVAPKRLPVSDPLAGVGGATNAISYTTDVMGTVTLVGAGAGREETGFAILADLLAIPE